MIQIEHIAPSVRTCRGSIYPPASPEGEADGGQVESRFAGRHKCRPYKELKREFLYYELSAFRTDQMLSGVSYSWFSQTSSSQDQPSQSAQSQTAAWWPVRRWDQHQVGYCQLKPSQRPIYQISTLSHIKTPITSSILASTSYSLLAGFLVLVACCIVIKDYAFDLYPACPARPVYPVKCLPCEMQSIFHWGREERPYWDARRPAPCSVYHVECVAVAYSTGAKLLHWGLFPPGHSYLTMAINFYPIICIAI